MTILIRAAMPLLLLAGLAAGCTAKEAASEAEASDAAGHTGEDGLLRLTPQQIAAAGITLERPIPAGSGALVLPGTIESDPDAIRLVSAAIGGRVVALTRNLGQPVARGETLAIIESREAATLKAEVAAAEARRALAQATLRREQRLFAERVSPEQDLIAARTAAAEADIALHLARQQLSAAGGGGVALNRLEIRAPIAGRVIARSAVLGQMVAADAELFRIADLAHVSVRLALGPDDAGRVRPGMAVDISAGERRAAARIGFVSPVLDAATRLVSAIAIVDNRDGQWRVGEPVTAAIRLPSTPGQAAGSMFTVPDDAVQTVAGRPTLFVRTGEGFRAVPVTLGQPGGDGVTVTSGLDGSERIAAAGSFILKAELGKGEAGHGEH